MPRKPRAAAGTVAPVDILEGVTTKKAVPIAQFQGILDYYNKTGNPFSPDAPNDPGDNLTGVALFVYRTFPKCDTKTPTKNYAYIEKIDCVSDQGAVTMLPENISEWIRVRHGGGGYSLTLNDKRSGGERNQVCGANLKIDEVEHTPIVDPTTLVLTDASTATWAARQVNLGVYMRNADGSFSTKENAAQSKESSTAEATVARIAERSTQGNPLADGYRQAMDLQQSTFQNLLALTSKKDGDAPTAQVLTVLVTMLQSSQQQNTQLIMKMMENKQAPPAAAAPAPLSSLKEAIEAVAALREIMPAPAAEAPWWLELGKSLGPALLPLAMQLIPKGGPAVAPGTAVVAAAPSGTAGNGEAPRGPDIRAVFAERAARFFEQQDSGSDLAQGIDMMMGPEYYDALRKQGKDNLTGILLQSAQAAAFTADGERTQVFLQEFIDYGNPPEGEGAHA